jgi:hypothetical protein
LHIKENFVRYGSVNTTNDQGETVTKDGKYHPKCFTCTVCDKVLSGGQTKFVAKDNGIFCSDCYQQAHAPRCDCCSKPIVEKSFIKMGGKNYHEVCLACSVCSKPARDEETNQLIVHSQDGAMYCKEHYVEAFAEKCAGCSFGIDVSK